MKGFEQQDIYLFSIDNSKSWRAVLLHAFSLIVQTVLSLREYPASINWHDTSGSHLKL